jgi:hypothetical protein
VSYELVEETNTYTRKKETKKEWTCTVERPFTISYSFDIPIGAKVKIDENSIRKYVEEDLCDIICKHISRTVPITWKILENKEVMIDVFSCIRCILSHKKMQKSVKKH